MKDELEDIAGFQWDEGNTDENRITHQVENWECEQIFFNRPLVTSADVEHSGEETRLYALGQADSGRHLFVVFTVRNALLRIISARDMSRKERKVYQKS